MHFAIAFNVFLLYEEDSDRPGLLHAHAHISHVRNLPGAAMRPRGQPPHRLHGKKGSHGALAGLPVQKATTA